MPTHFRLTVTFLDPQPAFHGRGDGGEPEWPPTPLRVYQALVATAARRLRADSFDELAGEAFGWLEGLPPPEIVCPPTHVGTPVRTAVPNNDLDKWARALAGGRVPDKQPNELKTLKTVRPTWLRDGTAVRYVWRLGESAPSPRVLHTLRELAHHITHLGWGIDQAVGRAELLDTLPADDPAGDRWVPGGGDVTLRVPMPGTLADLRLKHAAFLRRVEPAGFDPVPQLTAFGRVGYRNANDPPGRPSAAFELLNPDPEVGGRVAFDAARRTRDVAAWVRNAVDRVCRGWPDEYGDVGLFVHGHDPAGGPAHGPGADRRFQYLPLPTVNHALGSRVESVRRVLVAAPPGCEPQLEWVRRRLTGQPLRDLDAKDGDPPVALLNRLPDEDWVRRQYTGAARAWATVTPVVLPGYDDRDPRSAGRLVWRAFEQAGLPPEALAGATAEWRAVGYRAGVEPAVRYRPADELGRWPRYHVRVRFARPVAGPLAVGAGRYRGFGLFVRDDGG